jgi:hypothetical protein
VKVNLSVAADLGASRPDFRQKHPFGARDPVAQSLYDLMKNAVANGFGRFEQENKSSGAPDLLSSCEN